MRCLDLESEAAAAEAARSLGQGKGEQAERSGTTLVNLAIRAEQAGFGGRVVVVLGKRDRRESLPWNRLNPGTPVLLTEQGEPNQKGWRGVVADRDRETISVTISESPEPTSDRPLFRLDQSTDEIAFQR